MLAVVEDAVDPAVVVVAVVEDVVVVCSCSRGVYVDGSMPAYAPPDNSTNL